MHRVSICCKKQKKKYIFLFDKGRSRVRPQIGPLTFLKIFLLEIIYIVVDLNTANLLILLGLIIFTSLYAVFFSLYVNDLYTIPMLTKSSDFSIINTAHIDLQNNIK